MSSSDPSKEGGEPSAVRQASPLRPGGRSSRRAGLAAVLLPATAALVLLGVWDALVRLSGSVLFPRPVEVGQGIVELVERGLLWKYIAASLFRVSWGYLLAVAVGVPFGLFLGWFRPARQTCNPFIQIFRPISPIAWIPVAILWFGVSEAAPIFLIFLASFFPIATSAMAAVRGVPSVYLRAARISACRAGSCSAG